jgi:hypothetical protein
MPVVSIARDTCALHAREIARHVAPQRCPMRRTDPSWNLTLHLAVREAHDRHSFFLDEVR